MTLPRWFYSGRFVLWLSTLAVLAVVAVAIFALAGCHNPFSGIFTNPLGPSSAGPVDTELGREAAKAGLARAAKAIGWVSGLCAVGALGTLIASFFVPIIPRKASVACLAAALLGYATQYGITAYGQWLGEFAFWGSIGVLLFMGGTIGVPWLMALKNKALLNTSAKLAEGGHVDAAVAMKAVALSLTPEQRKTELAALTAPTPD